MGLFIRFVCFCFCFAVVVGQVNINFAGLLSRDDSPTSSSTPAPPPTSPLASVSLVHFNDMYLIEGASATSGGVARLATFRKAAGKNSLLLFSGDALFPSIMSTIFKAENIIETFNALNITAAVVGNHEFDGGLDFAISAFKRANFPWLASNLLDARTNQTIEGTKVTHKVTVDGVTFGFIGLVENWLSSTLGGGLLKYQDAIAVGKKLAVDLKFNQGCDYVIALTHSNADTDVDYLANIPELDLVLGGHDHILIWRTVDTRTVWKSGSDLANVGSFRLSAYKNSSPLLHQLEKRLIPLDASVAMDAALKVIVEKYTSQLNASLSVTLGTFGADLDFRTAGVRSGEINGANLVVDALFASLKKKIPSAAILLCNSGSIRANKVYPANSAVTKRTALEIIPFGTESSAVELTGAVLRATLELSVSKWGQGGFLQVAGMSFSYDPNAPAGSRIITMKFKNGTDIQPNDKFIAGINEFMRGGGDSYSMLVLPDVDKRQIPMNVVLMTEFESMGSLTASLDGRIQRLDSKGKRSLKVKKQKTKKNRSYIENVFPHQHDE